MSNTITEIFDSNWTVNTGDNAAQKLSIFKNAIRAVTEALDLKVNHLEQEIRSRDAKIAELEELVKGKGENTNEQRELKDFSIKKAAAEEVSRVRDSVIINFSSDAPKVGKDIQPDLITKMNSLRAATGANDNKNFTKANFTWESLKSPREGRNKDSKIFRLTITGKMSKKAFFRVLKKEGHKNL